MDKIQTNSEYQTYVDKKSPNSPILKNCLNAFWVRWTYMYSSDSLSQIFVNLGDVILKLQVLLSQLY